MPDLNNYLNGLDRAEAHAEEIADDITHLYRWNDITDRASLYHSGTYVGHFTLDEAIEYATTNDSNDRWTINEEEE